MRVLTLEETLLVAGGGKKSCDDKGKKGDSGKKGESGKKGDSGKKGASGKKGGTGKGDMGCGCGSCC